MQRLARLAVILTVMLCVTTTGCGRWWPSPSRPTAPVLQPLRELMVTMAVPDRGWRVRIDDAYLVGNELWAIAVVERTGNVAAQLVTLATDTAQVRAPAEVLIKYFVLGKTWGWGNTEPYTFLRDIQDIATHLQPGRRLSILPAASH